MRDDGPASTSTVEQTLRHRGLLLPQGFRLIAVLGGVCAARSLTRHRAGHTRYPDIPSPGTWAAVLSADPVPVEAHM